MGGLILRDTILVTGGAGYIGRHTCAALREAGFRPVPLDNRPRGGGYPFVHVDLRDARVTAEVVAELQPIAVVHLAAHSDVEESRRAPDKYGENVRMTANLAAAAPGLPIVLASSAAVYGEGGGAAELAEGAVPAPINAYGVSKLASEWLLPQAMRLRYFNVAGGTGGRPNHLLPRIAAAMAGGPALPLNGGGRCVRDFVHVTDVARANVLAVEHLLGGGPARALNISSGQGCTVAQLADTCETLAGRAVPRHVAPPRPGDPARLVGDNALAAEVLGWAPSFSLREIAASALEAVPLDAHGLR